ncbi:MAG: ferredoxin--NADP reductase [Bacteriovoracia bacterium]
MPAPPIVNWTILKRTDLSKSPSGEVFELKVKRPEGFQFKAGQYISIVIPGAGPGGRDLRRAYSIASPPEWDEIELCIKKVENGPGTTYLGSLKEGDHFRGQGPFGDFVLEHDQSLPSLFIGTGTGIAPLRSMVLSDEWVSKADVGFLLGVRHEQDTLYPELFDFPKVFAKHEDVKLVFSRPTENWIQKPNQFKGRVTDYLRQMTWDTEKTKKAHYYLCGNGEMIKEVKEILATKGVDKENIHTEKYY